MDAQDYLKIDISEKDAQEIENAYDNIMGMLKKLSAKTDTKALSKNIANLVEFVIESLSAKDEPLLLYISKIFDKDYIFAHSLNVCLISVKIGLRLDFGRQRLKDLGFLALTHAAKDIGLPEELSSGMEADKELNEIIKLADVYDALSHPPAYRHATTPSATLTEIINTDKFFDRRLIKILLEELSFYPKGSWVQLSSKEIGRVTKVDKKQLLRPTVEIFIDWEKRYLKQAKTIDLSKNNLVYVLRPLTEKEIQDMKKSEK